MLISFDIDLPAILSILIFIFTVYQLPKKSWNYDHEQQEYLNSDNIVTAHPVEPKIQRHRSYRFDEEVVDQNLLFFNKYSACKLWLERPTWYLPNIPRECKINLAGVKSIIRLLKKYGIDPHRGFLPEKDPIQRLSRSKYHIWEELADDLPKLLGAKLGQAREILKCLPLIEIDPVLTDDELRRMHLLLSLFAHAYIWGGKEPLNRLPRGISVPLWQISKRLNLPPILCYVSIVMYNWRRLDTNAEISMENLTTLNVFFGGRDESWFYLTTVEIEAKGAAAIIPIISVIEKVKVFMSRLNEDFPISNFESNLPVRETQTENCFDKFKCCASSQDEKLSSTRDEKLRSDLNIKHASHEIILFVIENLRNVEKAVSAMKASLFSMREGCDPYIFYHRVRPFLSGWKNNPSLPVGIIYEGVSESPMMYYGGSAAQSSLIPMLDIAFGISHDSNKSKDFLEAMREYMLPAHREFLNYLKEISCIREFVIFCSDKGLVDSEKLKNIYDECVFGLEEFRTIHLKFVTDYIIFQQKKELSKSSKFEDSAGGKGTGGTDLITFLKPLKDDCNKCLLK